MSDAVERYARVKATAERLRSERDRAQGSLDQLMTTLRERFKCRTLAEAEKKLAALRAEQERDEAERDRLLSEFEREYRDVLS